MDEVRFPFQPVILKGREKELKTTGEKQMPPYSPPFKSNANAFGCGPQETTASSTEQHIDQYELSILCLEHWIVMNPTASHQNVSMPASAIELDSPTK